MNSPKLCALQLYNHDFSISQQQTNLICDELYVFLMVLTGYEKLCTCGKILTIKGRWNLLGSMSQHTLKATHNELLEPYYNQYS